MKLGILSDTHGLLREEFKEELKQCDYIIHAGDIGTEKCYNELKALGVPLYMVRGNCDHGQWATYIPETLAFPIGGLIFYLIHDLSQLPYLTNLPDVIIFGHTHTRACYQRRGCTYVNPGTAGRARGVSGISMAIAEIIDGEVQVRYVEAHS